MSFAVEVIADGSSEFVGNGLRFATQMEAQSYAADLKARWSAVRSTRTTESTEPVNACFGSSTGPTEQEMKRIAEYFSKRKMEGQ